MSWKHLAAVLALAALPVLAGCKGDQDATAKPAPPPVPANPNPDPPKPTEPELPHPILLERMYYPLAVCAVDGKALPDKPKDLVHAARLVRLCSAGCLEQARKDPAAAFARVDHAYRDAQRKDYPRTSCVICLEKLGPGAVEALHNRRLVVLCGAPCKATFDKDPQKYVDRVEKDLIDRRMPLYPFTLCVVSEKALVHSETDRTDPIDFLWGPHLVRVCCQTCFETFHRKYSWEEKLRTVARIEKERERKGLKPKAGTPGN